MRCSIGEWRGLSETMRLKRFRIAGRDCSTNMLVNRAGQDIGIVGPARQGIENSRGLVESVAEEQGMAGLVPTEHSHQQPPLLRQIHHFVAL